ncbi:MAG: hypothetical protein J7M05_12825 [Anaerolineae bacterium]|nr:hypothetical protein [Anaerolineae bacterium]
MTENQPGSPKSLSEKVLYLVIGVALLVLLVQLILVFFPTRVPKQAMEEPQVATSRPRPTRTFTPSATPVPPTSTPTLMATPIPPTDTPTATPVPPTATPVPPTATPVPPTKTPRPPRPTPKPKPPTATPVPVTILDQVPIDNGEWGKNFIFTDNSKEVYVQGNDGHRYRAEIGFLSSPQAVAKVQEFWRYGGRGGGNWKMILVLRDKVAWVSCTSDKNVCYETYVNSGQCSLFVQIYLKNHVWTSLLNDYLQGGWQATTRNPYYAEVQKAVFDPICKAVPDVPCVGFRFTRVD